jgi:uncharacterized protein YdhG (YjbR/CyaY superfamily)
MTIKKRAVSIVAADTIIVREDTSNREPCFLSPFVSFAVSFSFAVKMTSMKMDSKAQNVTDYIAVAPQQVQPMLNQIRAAIQQVAPNATEYISYGMPVFKYEKPFIGFAAMKNHIGFYPMSGSFVAAHKKELAGYTTSKGAIQLPLDKPLPLTLIKKVVKLRIKETKESGGHRS